MPISTNDLTPNTQFLIRGRVSFSRIAHRVEGDELQRDIQRQRQQGRRVIHDKPYTSLSIDEAVVIMKNPQNPTKEEQFAQERLYKSTAKGAKGYSFTGRNKSNSLPSVLISKDGGRTAVPLSEPLTGELAPGLDVTLIMRVFNSPQNNGVSLDGVIVNEPIRYYSPNTLDLSDYGITVTAPAQALATAPATSGQPAAPAPSTPAAPAAPAATYPAYPSPADVPAPSAAPAYPNYDANNGAPAAGAGITYNLNDRQY